MPCAQREGAPQRDACGFARHPERRRPGRHEERRPRRGLRRGGDHQAAGDDGGVRAGADDFGAADPEVDVRRIDRRDLRAPGAHVDRADVGDHPGGERACGGGIGRVDQVVTLDLTGLEGGAACRAGGDRPGVGETPRQGRPA